eukprot:SAG11_NODE_191_length_12943_cov_3.853706_7_plen_83_part_00
MINKAIVAAIVIFYGEMKWAWIALGALIGVSLLFGFLARFWAEKLENDGDDSNDAQEVRLHKFRNILVHCQVLLSLACLLAY